MNRFRLICLDRDTGREAWSRSCVKAVPHEGTHSTNGFASASPCADGERVYAHFGSRGLHAYALAGDRLWSRDFGDMTIRHGFGEGSSPTVAGDRLYSYKEKTGLLTCIDATTGAPHYETARIPGVGRTYASPVAAGGHVYLTDRDGRITVIEDAPRLAVVAENDVGEGVDATPAQSGESLFVRGERHVFRFARP